jgi:8-oxo-dGTP diphosphatase
MPFTEYVAGFLFDDTRPDRPQVLLVQKAKPDWHKGKLNAVGGKIEPNESPDEAMAREFGEETGLYVGGSEWTHRVTLFHRDWRVYFFAAKLSRLAPRPIAAKGSEEEPVRWCYWQHVYPDNIIWNLRWLIPLCYDDDVKGGIEIQDTSTPETGMTATQNRSK